MNVLEEVPPGQVYLIPVRLDDCDVPDALAGLHYVDLSDTVAFEKLIAVMTAPANKRMQLTGFAGS